VSKPSVNSPAISEVRAHQANRANVGVDRTTFFFSTHVRLCPSVARLQPQASNLVKLIKPSMRSSFPAAVSRWAQILQSSLPQDESKLGPSSSLSGCQTFRLQGLVLVKPWKPSSISLVSHLSFSMPSSDISTRRLGLGQNSGRVDPVLLLVCFIVFSVHYSMIHGQ
jgi:hypothetical protein